MFSYLPMLILFACLLAAEAKFNNLKNQISKKLNIEVYYETLCPDSKRFINNQVSKIFTSELLQDMTNLVLIPYGKAKYDWNKDTTSWNFECQHGEDECLGNRIHNCLIYNYNEFKEHFEFINCTMSNLKDNIIDVSSSCAKKYSLPFENLKSCANDLLGNSLLHGAGVLTDSLLPRLNYVPWIVVDKLHTNEMQKDAENDLVGYICKNYRGSIDTSNICKSNFLPRLEPLLPVEFSMITFLISAAIFL